jgi:hypothetical protein
VISGAQSAKECSFPTELLETGRCTDWTAAYCAQNLARMTSLDQSPPPPKRPNNPAAVARSSKRKK